MRRTSLCSFVRDAALTAPEGDGPSLAFFYAQKKTPQQNYRGGWAHNPSCAQRCKTSTKALRHAGRFVKFEQKRPTRGW